MSSDQEHEVGTRHFVQYYINPGSHGWMACKRWTLGKPRVVAISQGFPKDRAVEVARRWMEQDAGLYARPSATASAMGTGCLHDYLNYLDAACQGFCPLVFD